MRNPLSVTLGRLKLANPVMVASGTFGYAREFRDFLDVTSLGAIVTKTITRSPRPGNPPPRTCETPAGMLNSIGLENPGLEAFIADKLPFLAGLKVPLIVSIAASDDPREFRMLIEGLERCRGIAGYELNISCPNVRHPGRKGTGLIAQDARQTYALVKGLRLLTRRTLVTKLSPNVTDIVEIARAAADAGSDALALINTLTGMSVDVVTRRPRLARGFGGLSGPAVRPVAVRMVREVYRAVDIPLIGMGGITDTDSALEFIIAGATAISVGTANFVNPKAAAHIVAGLRRFLREHKIARVSELTGSLKGEAV